MSSDEDDSEPPLVVGHATGIVHGTVWEGKTTVAELLALQEGQQISMEISAGPWAVARKLEIGSGPGPVSIIAAGWLESISMADVLSLVQTIKLDGELVCEFAECSKTVHFERGTIVFAGSTLADDRLVERLLARGWISRDVYNDMNDIAATGTKRLGRVLVEQGALTEPQLYDAVTEQIENIVISLFAYASGSFVFSAKPLDVENPIKLPRPMMYYILEGARKRDELDESLSAVGNRDAVFRRSDKELKTESDAPGIEDDVLALVDGTSRVWQLLTRSSWSETNTRLALARLLRTGAIEPVVKAPNLGRTLQLGTSPADLTRALEMADRFNEFFREVHRIVVARNISAETFRDFLTSRPQDLQGVFDGVTIGDDGALDTRRILGNLTRLHLPQTETTTLLRAALEDAVEFCLWLVREQAEAEDAKRIQEQARRLLLS